MPHACRPPHVSLPSCALCVAVLSLPKVQARPVENLARLSVVL